MNFTYFLTTEEVKQNGMINTNVDIEYIDFALQEAQSVYLREILGDLLYNSLINKVNSDTLNGKYQTLVNDYIKIYLSYKMLSLIVIGVNFKIRNAGVVQQFDQGFNTTGMKDTKYIQEQYDTKSEFYANRLTTYLQKNTVDFPEYGYSDDNITQPTETQNVTTIYLGGGRKKGCGCNTSTPQATATTVEWDNIQNRPDFAQVAYSNDYNDLDNKPEIPSVEGYATEEWVSEQGYSTFSGDYNDLTNKPTIPTVPTNVSAFTNDAGYTTFSGDYNDLTNKPTIPVVPTNVSAFTNDAGYTTFDGDYNSLTNKPTIPAPQVQADWQQNDSTQPDYIKNRPSMPSAQIQSDWNQTNTSEVDYIKNKPTIPTVPTNVSAFTNDAGYLTQHQSLTGYATETWVQQQGYSTFDGDYNSLSNKPTIPAAQVQSDWNANSGMGEILNKPNYSSEVWTFELSGGTTVTKKVVIDLT